MKTHSFFRLAVVIILFILGNSITLSGYSESVAPPFPPLASEVPHNQVNMGSPEFSPNSLYQFSAPVLGEMALDPSLLECLTNPSPLKCPDDGQTNGSTSAWG